MIQGSCLCEGVKYRYTKAIDEVAICHCNQCKRAQGTPFAVNAPIHAADFSFTEGAELIREFFSSPEKKRVFCSVCASPLYSQRTDMPDTIRLRLVTVTEGDIPEPNYEIYCDSKSEWFCESDERPAYNQNKS